MEDLPPPILLEILSRLGYSADLASCRLACRALRSLSYDVQSVRLVCSYERFLRSRAPETRDRTVPFKSLVANLASLLSGGGLESLSLGIERHVAPNAWEEDDFDDSDDLHLTAADFVSRWLPLVGRRLRSLSISDYWIQSCWRRSEALSLISDCCDGLLNLEIRNAWLSIEGLKPMLKLTTLTLEFIRLDDEDLDKVNECFPSLQVLNLVGVGGLKEPRIHLSQLKICRWTVSNFPLSLTIDAPNLIELELKCVEPKALVLKTPSLSDFNLKIRKPSGVMQLESSLYLKSLRMESSDLRSLTQVFMGSNTVKKLELESPGCIKSDELLDTVTFGDLVSAFPNMDHLKLGPGAWVELERSFEPRGIGIACEWRSLKKLMVHLPLLESDIKFISFMLVNLCTQFCEVAIFIHADASAATRKHFISNCISNFPKVRWKWGMWKESSDDLFLDL